MTRFLFDIIKNFLSFQTWRRNSEEELHEWVSDGFPSRNPLHLRCRRLWWSINRNIAGDNQSSCRWHFRLPPFCLFVKSQNNWYKMFLQRIMLGRDVFQWKIRFINIFHCKCSSHAQHKFMTKTFRKMKYQVPWCRKQWGCCHCGSWTPHSMHL